MGKYGKDLKKSRKGLENIGPFQGISGIECVITEDKHCSLSHLPIRMSKFDMKIFGRLHFLSDKDEFMKFEQAGGHKEKCLEVVGTATRWLVHLLAEEDLID